ncbi:hypothetical protein L211DRAFT_620598 [Terfezia boudieri ATCC MYA-4762]|uniref:Uncharacterized protein n=1 Tax=Terfezia boudieri ATCC MYA-4762 TaxID=1051890 RepID=A0A3N4LNK8_9PEZI|nr:hypothetical protein L211DRAFT_620598 [Terfezia boudieri ATCC MYA-4762]
MPPTTRRSASSRASRTPSQQQQTINFCTATKVTKPVFVHPSKLPKARDVAIAVDIAISTRKPKVPAPEPTLEDELAAEEHSAEDPSEPSALSPTPTRTPIEPELEPESDTELTTYVPPPVEEKPLSIPSLSPLLQDLPADVTTSFAKLSRHHINLYHKTILASRSTPPVHQSGLSPTEKILRYFDLSSQYGPSIGITRINRWKRAYRMGMNPPIEGWVFNDREWDIKLCMLSMGLSVLMQIYVVRVFLFSWLLVYCLVGQREFDRGMFTRA